MSRVRTRSPAAIARWPRPALGGDQRAGGKAGNDVLDVCEGQRADDVPEGVEELDGAVLGIVRIVDDPAGLAGQVEGVEVVAALAAVDGVAQRAEKGVAAVAARERIGPVAAVDQVVAGAAEDGVVAGAAVEQVVAAAAVEQVVAGAAVEDVGVSVVGVVALAVEAAQRVVVIRPISPSTPASVSPWASPPAPVPALRSTLTPAPDPE